MAWPKQVPVLTAEDIHRDEYHNKAKTKCCLAGHCNIVFQGTFDDSVETEEGKTAWAVIEALCFARYGESTGDKTNDNRKHTKAEIAALWNDAMAALGYTEVVEVDA